MTRDHPSIQPLDLLMAKVGYLLLCWGWLEQALDLAVLQLAQADSEFGEAKGPTSNFSEKLKRWREQHRLGAGADAQHFSAVESVFESVTDAQVVRNAICHGLSSASADPKSGEAYIKTSNRGVDTEYTASKLTHLIQQIEHARIQIPRLTLVAAQKK